MSLHVTQHLVTCCDDMAALRHQSWSRVVSCHVPVFHGIVFGVIDIPCMNVPCHLLSCNRKRLSEWCEVFVLRVLGHVVEDRTTNG